MTTNFIDQMNERAKNQKAFAKAIAKRAKKTVRQMNQELAKSRRCEYCGEHGHKEKDCQNK